MGLVLAAAMAAGPTHAEPPPVDAAAPSTDDPARRARTALTIGGRKVTVGEIEERMASIPPFQLATFGASRDEVVRAYVDQVLVRDLVLAAGAESSGLANRLPAKELLRRARSTATLRTIRGRYPSAAAIPMDDVQKYYDDNRSRFDSPERINLWRILCKTNDEATQVLEAARKEPTIAKYNELARDHSIDKATNMRGGNLGFVGPDGVSNEAGVKVDPALVKAAEGVKDGELVPTIVPEAGAFAVVWRRGTVPANRRTVEEATAQIRAALFRERTESAEKKLIDELKAKNVKEVNAGLLGIIELRPFDAGLSPRR
ncbi:MAG: peptidyl-prolyl cis-trans isomerase [Labilithrix sp.]|nr:peptidyl-prolyl cis-trans isomerase [Labilithrix sp.]